MKKHGGGLSRVKQHILRNRGRYVAALAVSPFAFQRFRGAARAAAIGYSTPSIGRAYSAVKNLDPTISNSLRMAKDAWLVSWRAFKGQGLFRRKKGKYSIRIGLDRSGTD